jgi:type I restriction-modification system DNA methylase subunit
MIDPKIAFETIQKLLEKYQYLREGYLRGQYNETQLRRDFIDPFFKALDWDVDNTKGFSEAYREVVHEEPIPIRGATKHVDYAFRVGGNRKFVVETKKPSVKIQDDAESALQLRRYAWNADLHLSILTNFEEFAVYDCTKKPLNSDDAGVARIEYFTFREYPSKWKWIVSIFSQDSILKGSFDRFVATTRGKKGTVRVNDDILAEIEGWRESLAKNIALRNPALSVEELNAAVQRTIDRVIFLRICEDRKIEPYETLKKLLEVDRVYEKLSDLFRHADDRYNSGIFHFQVEKDREPPDTFTLNLVIDDKVLKEIIKRLYYPESPYEFSVIPPVILGQVYEQFLGKVIRLTEGHHAKVEEKPEVKKAGGVYYTPQFVVDYIVKHTVGELVKDKTPKEVSKLRILDPACGSGSFLLGAYQFLLDWHRDWYIENLVKVFADMGTITAPEVQALLPEPPAEAKGKKGAQRDLPIYKVANGGESRVRSDWKLTTTERKRILLNNIYGVDIDTQAVEVTKLSLLLKVLEEENEETVSKQLTLFQERALPSLHKNIRCGNSLIGPDFFQQKQIAPYNFEEQKRINPFDWNSEFSEIMGGGGFEAVIGNPPYVRQESLGQQFKEYAGRHYEAYAGTADLYVYFFEKAHSLLHSEGYFGMISSNKFMRANYGSNLRKFLSKKSKIIQIIDFGELPVFQNASTFPCIYITQNSIVKNQNFIYAPVKSLQFASLEDEVSSIGFSLDDSALQDNVWTLVDKSSMSIIEKMNRIGTPLGQYINNQIYRGLITGLNKVFVIDEKTKLRLISLDGKNSDFIKPFIVGDDIRKYHINFQGKYLILIPKGWTNKNSGDTKNKWRWLQENYPAIA